MISSVDVCIKSGILEKFALPKKVTELKRNSYLRSTKELVSNVIQPHINQSFR